nr:uncharacterized protein LOC124490052 [Dermatophagoides farinae]
MIRFPYKPLYGLPVRLNCPDHVRKEFNGCELYARDEWSISIDEYFYPSRKFCCFAWLQLSCEIIVASKCHQKYAILLSQRTKQMFDPICNPRGYSHESIQCWWSSRTESSIVISFAIALSLLICCLIAVLTSDTPNAKYSSDYYDDYFMSTNSVLDEGRLDYKWTHDSSRLYEYLGQLPPIRRGRQSATSSLSSFGWEKVRPYQKPFITQSQLPSMNGFDATNFPIN